MIIEKLTAPEGPNGRFGVELDTGGKLRVEPSIVAEFGLYAGMELDEDLLARIRAAQSGAAARARAVRIISSSGVSRKELRHRLVQKGENENDADGAIEWLDGLDLLDDAAMARQLALSAVRKGYGPARIRQIFYQKGIPRELWEDAMADLPASDDAIDRFLSSRFRGEAPDKKEVKRAVDALLRRGHRWEEIQAALRRYTDSLDDLLEE